MLRDPLCSPQGPCERQNHAVRLLENECFGEWRDYVAALRDPLCSPQGPCERQNNAGLFLGWVFWGNRGITSLRSVIPIARRRALAKGKSLPPERSPFFVCIWGLMSKLHAPYTYKKTSACAEVSGFCLSRRKGDSNPRYSNPVRQFSKLLV